MVDSVRVAGCAVACPQLCIVLAVTEPLGLPPAQARASSLGVLAHQACWAQALPLTDAKSDSQVRRRLQKPWSPGCSCGFSAGLGDAVSPQPWADVGAQTPLLCSRVK